MKLKAIVAVCSLLSLRAVAASYEHRAVAAVLMGEAWNQGSNGMVAVMEVIHQRSTERQRTLWGVITTPKAFSCLNGVTPDRLIRRFENERDFGTALAIAQMSRAQMPGITRRANHFTHKKERPVWAKGRNPVVTLKDHSFYRLEP